MNTDLACSRRRAATTVWTSPEVACSLVAVIATRRPWWLSSRRDVLGGLQHVLAHPRLKLVAVAAELVPAAIEVVVARGDVQAVGGLGPTRRFGHRVDHPAGDDHAAGPRLELVDDPLHRHQRPVGGQDGLLLHAGDAP